MAFLCSSQFLEDDGVGHFPSTAANVVLLLSSFRWIGISADFVNDIFVDLLREKSSFDSFNNN